MSTPETDRTDLPMCEHVKVPRSCFTCQTGRFAPALAEPVTNPECEMGPES